MKIFEQFINEASNGKNKEFDAILQNVKRMLIKKHVKLNSMVMLDKLYPKKATFLAVDPQEYHDDEYVDIPLSSAEYSLLKKREKEFHKYADDYDFMMK